jgi:hypothetical protein
LNCYSCLSFYEETFISSMTREGKNIRESSINCFLKLKTQPKCC